MQNRSSAVPIEQLNQSFHLVQMTSSVLNICGEVSDKIDSSSTKIFKSVVGGDIVQAWIFSLSKAAQSSSSTATTSQKQPTHLMVSCVVVHSSGSRSSSLSGNVKKCAVGKHPKSEKHGNTAQFSEVERSGTQENCGGIESGCRLRLRPLPVLRRRQSQRVARIDPNAVVVDKNIAENDRFDLFSR